MEGNLFVGNGWCVSLRERKRGVGVGGIKVITCSCFFFFPGKYIITEFSSSSSFLLRMVLWIKVMTCSYLFFFLISTLLLNSPPLPFFCSLSFLLHLLQVRVTVKQMVPLNSELYALQFQVFLLTPSYV